MGAQQLVSSGHLIVNSSCSSMQCGHVCVLAGALFEESGSRGVEIERVTSPERWNELRSSWDTSKPLVITKAALPRWNEFDDEGAKKFMKECVDGLQAGSIPACCCHGRPTLAPCEHL